MKLKNYYTLLGVDSHSQNIYAAYSNSIYGWVPDHFKDPDFVKQISEFYVAYKILSNPKLRKLFDHELTNYDKLNTKPQNEFQIKNHFLVISILWLNYSSITILKRDLCEDKLWERALLWWVR